MTPAQLKAAGEALYGLRWRSQLARDIGVALRTMQRWESGEWPVPDGAAHDIRKLIAERRMDLDRLAAALSH